MCGLTGYLNLNNKQTDHSGLLKKMNAVIAHRGPDADGFFFDGSVGFGHRRLSIIDVSAGQQPMKSPGERLTIVFNGEIYNYLDINDELRSLGHQFDTHSDTETILKAYQEWGVHCLDKLNGMFAFAIWDKQKQSMFIARDRIGEKPLYYTIIDNTLFFASELKSLKEHPAFDFSPCPKAVEDFMTFGYVPEPKSFYQNTFKLCSGHYAWVTAQDDSVIPVQYWDIPPETKDQMASSEEVIIDRLKQATNIRMMSEVPLGAFLSGGVDSSAVVATMSELQDEAVNTVAIGFDVPEVNESEFAQMVAERYQTNHTLEVVDHDNFDIIDKLANIYDEPFADSSALPTFRVCQVAKKQVTVCLSGDGGDELFVGYRRYRLHNNESKVRDNIPAWLRRLIFKPLASLYPKLDWAPRFLRAKTTFQSLSMSNAHAYLNSMSKVREEQRLKLYSDEFKAKLGGYHSRSVFNSLLEGREYSDPIKEAQYLDMKTWMPGDILVKVDRASMANSLEVRVPMLDHTFVEWALSQPSSSCLKGNNGKANLKKALEPFLPDDVMYREKMGFSIPLAEWLRGPLSGKLKAAIQSPALVDSGLFKQDYVNSLFDQHISGQANHEDVLWQLLVLSNVLSHDLEKQRR